MKKALCAALALILILTLAACGAKQEPVEAPAQTDSPAAAPVEDMPAEYAPAEDVPAPLPEEPAAQPEEPVEEPVEEAAHGEVIFAGGEIVGYYEELVSYSLYQPELRGLGSAEADAKVNDFYAKLVENLTNYAYEVVYKIAQERHTGADVTGTCGAMPAEDENTLRLGYVLTVHYADQTEDEVFDRIDLFDKTTGAHLGQETE